MNQNHLHGSKSLNTLHALLGELLSSYREEVQRGGKLFNLFVRDFLNLHHHIDRRDAKGLNEHRKNIGVVEDLLTNREDLLIRFAQIEVPEDGQLQNMLHLYYTTTPPEGMVGQLLNSTENFPVHPPSLGCCLNGDQMSLIAHCVNEAHLFEEVVDASTIHSLLEGKLTIPLHSRNNRLLAFFFDQLFRHGFIVSRWEHLLGQAGSILGPKGRIPLKHSQFANALTHARSNPNSIQEKIRQYIDKVAQMGENTGTANK